MLHVLLFISIYIFGFIFSLSKAPAFIFALYEVVYFFYPQRRWWGYIVPSISYSFYVVAFMGVLFLLKKGKSTCSIMAIPATKWIWILFFYWFLIGYIAVYPERHWDATNNYFKMLVTLCFAFYLVNDDKDFRLILWGYLLGAWYLSFVAYQTGRNSGDRVEGIGTIDTGGDSNMTAATLVPSLVLFLYYFWFSKKMWQKTLFALGGAFNANAIVLINSRGSFLGVIVSALYFMMKIYFSSPRTKNQRRKAILIVLLGMLGAASVIDESTINRFNSIKEEGSNIDEDEESGATRVLFWSASMDVAKDHPLGAGIATFEYYGRYYVSDQVNMGPSRKRAVHSTWFEALSDIGYPGFVLFITLLYCSWKMLSRSKKALKHVNDPENYYKIVAIQSGFLGLMCTITFINRLRAEILYWMILYSMLAYKIYVLKSSERKKEETETLKQQS